MEQYFQYYAKLEQQRWMVADKVRTDAFAKAIAEVVKPGDIVIDVGAGTGLLSMLCAKAGAKKVYALERSNMAYVAKDLIQENNFQDVIELFHGHAEDFKCPEKADVIVSEWLGRMAYVEGMVNTVIDVRDKYLKPGGIMLPAKVDVMLAPVDDLETYVKFGPGFWEMAKIHGLDFSSLTMKELSMGHASPDVINPKTLIADGISLHHADLHQAQHEDEWCMGMVEFEMKRDGVLNGFAAWFNTQLSPGVFLDTSPLCPETHWRQTYFPFYPIEVKKGNKVRVDFKIEEPEDNWRSIDFTIRIDTLKITYLVT